MTRWSPPPEWVRSPEPPSDWRRLRPLTLADLIEATLRLYRRNLGLVLGVSALLQVPAYILSTFVGAAVWPRLAPFLAPAAGPFGGFTGGPRELPPDLVPDLLLFVAANLVAGIAAGFTGAALTDAAGRAYLEERTTVLRSFRAVVRKLLALVAGFAISVLAILGLVLLFSLLAVILLAAGGGSPTGGPGVFLALVVGVAAVVTVVALEVRWLLWVPAVMVEDVGGKAGLGRSWRLVGGSMWRVFGLALLVLVAVGILGAIVGSVAGALAGAFFPILSAGYYLSQGIAGSLVQLVLAPVMTIFLTILYFDLRVRKEGFDLPERAVAEPTGSVPGDPPAATGAPDPGPPRGQEQR